MFAQYFSPVVQWIECQIPVLMMGVRIPSGEQKKSLSFERLFLFTKDSNEG